MSKKCVNCGAELAENATFCPHCETKQTDEVAVKQPKMWRKKAVIAAVCVLVVAVVCGIAAVVHMPKTFEGGASVTYKDKDGTYNLMLAFTTKYIDEKQPQEEITSEQATDTYIAMPSQLAIYNGDMTELINDEFAEKIESCTVAAVPDKGGTVMLTSEPHSLPEVFPSALYVSDVQYTGKHGTNEIKWTINMKNGDTITLKHTLTATPIEIVTYSFEDTPLDTYEELMAVIDEIENEVDPTTITEIYLPPVTYPGGLTISKRTINLYGSIDGDGNKTTFEGGITLNTESPSHTIMQNICLNGSGSGIGLNTNSAAAEIYDSEFNNWETGIAVNSGSNVVINGCSFTGNGVGYYYNSGHATLSAEVYDSIVFKDNDIGLQVLDVPGGRGIDFAHAMFSGNGTDIDNTSDAVITTSDATFE